MRPLIVSLSVSLLLSIGISKHVRSSDELVQAKAKEGLDHPKVFRAEAHLPSTFHRRAFLCLSMADFSRTKRPESMTPIWAKSLVLDERN